VSLCMVVLQFLRAKVGAFVELTHKCQTGSV